MALGTMNPNLAQSLAAAGQQAEQARRAREAMLLQSGQAQQPSLGDLGMRLAMASMGPGGGAGAALGGAEAPGVDAGGTLGPFMQTPGGLGGLGGAPAAAAGPMAVQPGPATAGQGGLGGLGGQGTDQITAAPWMRMPGSAPNNQLLAALLGARR